MERPSSYSIATSDIGEYRDGYMSNIGFDTGSAKQVIALQQKLGSRFSKGIWFQPESSLHVTLFDFIAPKIEYDVSRQELFRQQHEVVSKTMAQLSMEFHEFTIKFNALHVSQSAIYLQGEDDGSVCAIRELFTELYQLDERTKKPPAIIHSTIGRFTDTIDIDEINKYIQGLEVDVELQVDRLRLVHEQRLPMLEYEVLNTWSG